MLNLNDGEIKDVWISYKYGSAEDFFTAQFNALLQQCASNDTLPFFDHVKKDIPENGLNRTIMTDINKSAAELHSASIGAKENIYIFGKEAADLGFVLDTKKNIRPLLVSAVSKYGADRPVSNEMNVADSGAREKFQFMYNIEQFDERSQKMFRAITTERNNESQKIKADRQNEAVSFYKENIEKPENKQKLLDMLQRSKADAEEHRLESAFNAVMVHNIAQYQGGFDVIGKKYIDPANEIIAKQKFREEITKVRKDMADGKLPKDALMRSCFYGQKTASLMMSKDVEFTHKHEREELSKAKHNTRKLEYGFSR